MYTPDKTVLVLFSTLLVGTMSVVAFAEERPLLQEGKQTLYQRVLTTPSCNLSATFESPTGIKQPPFTRFYVYERRKAGDTERLHVGPDSFGNKAGWLNADCTVDWKMQMTLSLTNPAGRDPLLFFHDRVTPERLFSENDPSALLQPILENIANNGSDPSVAAIEPQYAVDMEENFYLLPVLNAEEIFTEQGFQVRLLNIASVTKESDPDMRTSTSSPNTSLNKGSTSTSGDNTLKGFSAAVVFVIDSTISMGPYINRTRDAIRNIYKNIEQEKLLDQVKFGLIAYRSSVTQVPGLEYVSKMYVDPSTVQDGQDFLNKVAELSPASVSTPSFDEDAFAGVMQALNEVRWTDFGARYIVLITDAGALSGDDPLSATGLDADQVRLEAEYRGVAIYTLHLKTSGGVENHGSAEAQYSDLANNAFLNKPLYYPVNAGNVDEFGLMVDSLAAAIASQVKDAYRGEITVGSALGANPDYGNPGSTEKTTAEGALLADAALLGHAMRLAYLGEVTGASAPPVFQAWISDRDFVRQNLPTTDVRVLLTKGQLSDLSDVVKQIAEAANEGLISPNDMFERLRSVAATMGKDPNQLQQEKAVSLAELGLMAEYLEGLPYLSEVLSLDEEIWKGMEGLEQEKFIRRLNTKLKYYQMYNADVDRWVSLAEGSDPREHVYPVPLEALP